MVNRVSVPLNQLAIVVRPEFDNVAVAKDQVEAGTKVLLNNSDLIISANVNGGHRFALSDIAANEFVLQYGHPIGTSKGIGAGDLISSENMDNQLPSIEELLEHNKPPVLDPLAKENIPAFEGHLRPDGRVGTRNWLLIVPTSMCASHEASQIATIADLTLHTKEAFPHCDGVTVIPHDKGCGSTDGKGIELLMRMLGHYIDHPNVGAAIVIDLGCEKTPVPVFEKYLGFAV